MTDDHHALPKFLTDLFGWYSMTMLAVGARTGLLDALRESPGTADELARRAGADARNTLEWLRALVAGGHALVDGGRFSLAQETAMVLGPGFPVDARAVVDFVAGSFDVLDTVAVAVKSGGGVAPSTYERAFGSAVGRVNTPIYAMALVDEWIAGIPGVADRLRAGGAAADLACGNGDAAAIVGRAFPDARVVGVDLAPASRDDLPANVELVAADVTHLTAAGEFDLAVCLDSFHHFGDPITVARQAHAALRPGGVFLVVESALSGDLAADAKDPFSVISFACGVLYCLQENLAAGGSGVSAGDGPGWAMDALSAAGFANVAVRPSPTGYHLITGTVGD